DRGQYAAPFLGARVGPETQLRRAPQDAQGERAVLGGEVLGERGQRDDAGWMRQQSFVEAAAQPDHGGVLSWRQVRGQRLVQQPAHGLGPAELHGEVGGAQQPLGPMAGVLAERGGLFEDGDGGGDAASAGGSGGGVLQRGGNGLVGGRGGGRSM